METVDAAVLEALGQFESATIQNAALFVRGYVPAGEDYSGPELRCMLPDVGTLVGYAMTAEKTALHSEPGSIGNADYYDQIAYADVPTIAVIQDFSDPPNRGALWGDEMAHILASLGCLGGVIGGCARDVPGTKAAGCGLWATGRVPGHGPSEVVRHGTPVTVAGLRIETGDILVCDADGVVRVPVDIAARVVEFAEKVSAKEAATFEYFKKPGFNIEMYESWRECHDGTWPRGGKPPIPDS